MKNTIAILDTETYSPTVELKARTYDEYKNNAETITFQYQEIDVITGDPLEDLQILTKWNDPEMLSTIANILNSSRRFRRVFIGINIDKFDLPILENTLKRNSIKVDYPFDNPFTLDLRPIRILQNKGSFEKDYLIWGTDNHLSYMIKPWYEAKNYQPILNYIKKENEQFLSWFQSVLRTLPKAKNIDS